jgi:hypothetical protein
MEGENIGARDMPTLRLDVVTGRYVSYNTGLGTRLARLFKRLGIRQKPGCGCAQRQRWLDEKVPLRWLGRQRSRNP